MDGLWPRVGRPWAPDFFPCPNCHGPAILWPLWFDREHPWWWRCPRCPDVKGRVDAIDLPRNAEET